MVSEILQDSSIEPEIKVGAERGGYMCGYDMTASTSYCDRKGNGIGFTVALSEVWQWNSTPRV